MSQRKVEFLWVNTPKALDYFITNLRGYFPIALDTEADSLHHYRESVCLIQVTHDSQHYLIDPLDTFPLTELWPPTSRHTWILHGADFDLRMLRRAGAPEPQAVFDTMLAAQLLGLKAFGYGALVQQFCGLTLDKGSQKADWSRRPLSQTMIDYAVQDTEYLEPIAETLGAQLDEKGRRVWHEQSCARVVESSKSVREDDPENDWRISGSALMSPAALAIVKELWHWREKEAESVDLPVFKVLHNELLLDLAAWCAEQSPRAADGRAALAATGLARARRPAYRSDRTWPPGASGPASTPRRNARPATRTPRCAWKSCASIAMRSPPISPSTRPSSRPSRRCRKSRASPTRPQLASSPNIAGARGSGSCSSRRLPRWSSRMVRPDSSTDFRRRKLTVALGIMAAGMAVALAWAAVQGWGRGLGYPYNTFLFNPRFRFTDLANTIAISKFSNPYLDPSAIYPPFAWLFLRTLSVLPNSAALVVIYFGSVAVLLTMLAAALRPVVPAAKPRMLICLALALTSYPVVLSFDRGNIEIVLAPLLGGAVFLLARGRSISAMLCLVPAICLKLYPALLLVLFVRERKFTLLACAILASIAISVLSLHLLKLPVQTSWNLYRQDVAAYTHDNVYQNGMLESSGSPWNAFKLALLSAGKLGLIPPIDFDARNDFIRTTYACFAAVGLLLVALLALHVCFLEKEFLRCAAALLVGLSMSAPAGGDYRLLHAGLALVCLIVLKTWRPHDLLAVILLALIMVPKKEIIFAYAGVSESGFADVSLAVIADPLLALAAVSLLAYDNRVDAGWSALRLRGLLRALRPRIL